MHDGIWLTLLLKIHMPLPGNVWIPSRMDPDTLSCTILCIQLPLWVHFLYMLFHHLNLNFVTIALCSPWPLNILVLTLNQMFWFIYFMIHNYSIIYIDHHFLSPTMSVFLRIKNIVWSVLSCALGILAINIFLLNTCWVNVVKLRISQHISEATVNYLQLSGVLHDDFLLSSHDSLI